MTRAKILIMNDQTGRGPELQNRLTAAGYAVASLTLPGSHALEKVAELDPDVVLTDMGIRGKFDGVCRATLDLCSSWPNSTCFSIFAPTPPFPKISASNPPVTIMGYEGCSVLLSHEQRNAARKAIQVGGVTIRLNDWKRSISWSRPP